MLQIHSLPPDNPLYPDALRQFRADPPLLSAIGNLQLLQRQKLAFFCSSECPDDIYSQTHSLMAALPAEIAVTSGFHSPVEKQVLMRLLQRTQAVIACPARGLDGMKLTTEWQTGVTKHRLLLLSIFSAKQSRATAKLAQTRNQLVAALADRILIAHATPNGKIATLAQQWQEQGKFLFAIEHPANQELLKLGARPTTSILTPDS